MSEQIFQEVPRNTSACVLVKDSGETIKVRQELKALIIKTLKPNEHDYIIEETENTYKITQRNVRKPAIMLVRLQSYKKSMMLYAYNSFEIYHGDCTIVNTKVRNDIEEKKLKEHVDNAIKTFKGQVLLSANEAKEYRETHKKEIAEKKKKNAKIAKEFSQIGINADKEGMVQVLRYHSNSSEKSYVQMSDMTRCHKIILVSKTIKVAETASQKIPQNYNDQVVYLKYNSSTNVWETTIYGMTVQQALDMWNKTKNGREVHWLETDNFRNLVKHKKKICPYIKMDLSFIQASVSEVYDNHFVTMYNYSFSSAEIAEIIKQFKLQIWKIQFD